VLNFEEAVQSGQLSDADIEKKIAEMQAARTARAFKASDARARNSPPQASSSRTPRTACVGEESERTFCNWVIL
jgi:hypothetical protein